MCLRYPGCPKWCRECCNCKKYLPTSVCYCIKLRIGCMIYGILQIILYSGLIGASLCYNIQNFNTTKNKESEDWMINQLRGASTFVVSCVGLVSAILAVLSIALVKSIALIKILSGRIN